MTAFGALPSGARSGLMIWAALLLFMLCYNFVRYVQQRRGLAPLLFITALFLAVLLLLEFMVDMTRGGAAGAWFAAVPWGAAAALLAGVSFLGGRQQDGIRRWKQTHITPGSIKECADGLPAGLCCSLPGGRPLLVNAAMEAQCRRLTGGTLLNAESFWSALEEGRLLPENRCVQTGSRPIVRLEDGTVLSFRRAPLELDGKTVWELKSADVTEEFRLSRQLARQREREDAVNRRLRALNGEIRQMTEARETLAFKMQVHDRMGQALLSARRYLLEPDPARLAGLTALWQENVLLLKEQRPDQNADPLGEVLRTAERLGVTVTLEGSLPRSPAGEDAAAAALAACLTNTLRHAGGTEMTVTSLREEGGFRLDFTNSGRPPAGPVREGGGLGNLRRKIEAMGGTMAVESAPRFRLTLRIPEETGEEADHG